MRINSEKLFDYINDLATNETVKFKVYYDDVYTTEIYWDGDNFNWDSGTFTSGAFFNPLYDFEIIEKNIEHYDMFDYFTGYEFGGTDKELLDHLQRNFQNINHELYYLTKVVNELKKENK